MCKLYKNKGVGLTLLPQPVSNEFMSVSNVIYIGYLLTRYNGDRAASDLLLNPRSTNILRD